MSDSSDSSTASDSSMDVGDREEFVGLNQDDTEWSDYADVADDDPVNDEEAQMEKNLSKLVLCSKHKKGQMLRTCPSCSAAIALITDKRIIEKLFLNTDTDSESAGASLVSRYSGRCDVVEPTLVLDPFTVKVAASIFTKGVWKDSRMWTEIIKTFLTLPIEQHEQLTSNLQVEELLYKFRNEPRFRSIFKYVSDLANCLKCLRISQRPLFMLMERLNKDITKLRAFATEVGIEFPAQEPARKGVNVPRTGRSVPDKLHYEKYEDIFPYPDLNGYLQKYNVSQEAEMDLRDLFEDYRARTGGKFIELYDMFSGSLNASDDFLIFYFDLISNTDAMLRELIRDRAASLFKKDIKSEVLSQTSSKKNKDENNAGLFCGDKILKTVLSDATKKSTILDKAVIPPRNSKQKESKHGPDRRPQSRSRSRSRSPDKNRDTGSRSNRFFRKNKSGNGGGKNKGSRNPKSKKKPGSSKN